MNRWIAIPGSGLLLAAAWMALAAQCGIGAAPPTQQGGASLEATSVAESAAESTGDPQGLLADPEDQKSSSQSKPGAKAGGIKDGWTVFTPSSDTRTVYVSSSRGDDGNNGLSPGNPKRTIAAGKARLRKGHPDWLLLKCDDTWDESLGQWGGLSGRSLSERMLVGSYGKGARPILRTGVETGVWLSTNTPTNFVAFVGIHFWANTYNGSNGTPDAIFCYERSQGILVEDCMMQGYLHGLVFESVPAQPWWHENVQIRRNVIVDSYSTTSTFAAGAYLYRCNGLLLEENLFDRNGWNESVAGSNPSWFLHNVYVHNENTGVIVRGNLVAGCDGVQVRPGGTVEDNVFLRTAIALEFGLGTNPNVDGVSGVIRNNVVLDGGDIGTNGPAQGLRGWGFLIGNITTLTVEKNIICNNTHGHGPRVFSIEAANGWSGNTRGVESALFKENIIFNWGGSIELQGTSAQLKNIQLQRNVIQNKKTADPLILYARSNEPVGVSSAGNEFSGMSDQSRWIRTAKDFVSFHSWKASVRDEGSKDQRVKFLDPDRTIESYQASLGGEATYEAFLAEARKQSKNNWRRQYTAEAVSEYIRKGFSR